MAMSQKREPAAAQDEPSAAAPDSSWLNREILDEFTFLERRVSAINHAIAASFGVTASDLLTLSKLDKALPMKELAQRMACDASFVTVVADTLEERGFLRREPSYHDRKVKNLVLTSEGTAARERFARDLAGDMPWCTCLDDSERRNLLSLLRRMRRA